MQPDTKNALDQISFSDDDINLDEDTKLGNFSFLEVDMNILPFKYKLHSSDKPMKTLSFVTAKQEFSLVIYLCVEDDSLATSRKLKKTLDTIYLSLPELEKIGITNKNILILMYFLKFSAEKTFNQIYPQMDYLSSCCTNDPNFNCAFLYCLSATGIPISVLAFNKNNSTRVESLKCFYLNAINDIFFFNPQQEKVRINVILWENGMLPSTTAIAQLIKSSGEKPMAAIPLIDSIPNNLYGEIQQFDIVLQQIYYLHYYDMTASSPLDHRFYYINIDENIYKVIKRYFNEYINPDAGVQYHDFKFGIFLDLFGYETFYIKEICVYYIENNISFNDFMKNTTEKKAGNFLVFFTLITSLFTQCSNIYCFQVLKKIFLFFQVLEILFEFIRPSITILIVYCVFQEAFTNQDERLTTFFIVLYSIFLICSMCFSLISPNQTGDDKTFTLLNVLFTLFFYLIFACGIVAIHFVRINNIDDAYHFKLVAMVVMMVLNVVFIAVPVVFHCDKIKPNLTRMIKYMFIAYPSYLTVFSFHALMNFTDQYGHNEHKGKQDTLVLNERKKIFLLLFVLTNSFIGFICFFLTTRTQRVNGILVLGILITVFNGVEMCAIVIGIIRLHIRKKKMRLDEKTDEQYKVTSEKQTEDKAIDVKESIKTEGDSLTHRSTPGKRRIKNEDMMLRDEKKKLSYSNNVLDEVKDKEEEEEEEKEKIDSENKLKKEQEDKEKEDKAMKFKRRSKKARTTKVLKHS